MEGEEEGILMDPELEIHYKWELTLLKREVDIWKERAEYWRNKCLTNDQAMDLAETISLGGKIKCGVCNKYHPCDCDK
jgi:hypothetical protein